MAKKRAKRKEPAVTCPKCGSVKTKVDWAKADNYRWAVVRGVLTAVAGAGLGGGFERVCGECGNRFEG